MLVRTFVNGYCPKFENNATICVEYARIPILGQASCGYKKMSFECDYAEDCECLDAWGRCPILVAAPDEPS